MDIFKYFLKKCMFFNQFEHYRAKLPNNRDLALLPISCTKMDKAFKIMYPKSVFSYGLRHENRTNVGGGSRPSRY